MLKKLAGLVALALLLTGCSMGKPVAWTAGTGKIKIVTSTNVWGSVANLVAGDLATVDALIYNTNQDPHSFEATARDQLLINEADIVVMNGGGYDDFVEQLVEADPTPAILVNAFQAAGDDQTRNEHIWFDLDQVGDVGAVIGGAIEAIDSSTSDQIWASVDAFRAELATRKAKLDAIAAAGTCFKVFATEPLVDYLLEDAGCVNVTPAEYSKAIEEERDVPPAVMQQALAIVKSKLSFVALNDSVRSAQIDQLLNSSNNPNYGFSELLPQDPDTYEYGGNYLDMVDGWIVTVGEKW